MHWTPTVCAGVMLGRQPHNPRNFKWKHGTGMETNPAKWMKKRELFVIKCLPCTQHLPAPILSKELWLWRCVWMHLSAFGSRGFAGEGGFSFQLIVWFFWLVFFFSSPFPSSTFCRRWHITISGQKSSLLSSPREAVPVSLFRWTSGGAWRAFWLNPVSFPLGTLYLNTMHGAEPGCAGESFPPLSPMGYHVHN